MTAGSLDLVPGTLNMLVLKTLDRAGELHGFGVLDWIRKTTSDQLVIEEGALYPALHRMEKEGWLVSEWGISERGRRAKYYHLTKAGRLALKREEAQWASYIGAVAQISIGPAEATE